MKCQSKDKVIMMQKVQIMTYQAIIVWLKSHNYDIKIQNYDKKVKTMRWVTK